MLLVTVFFFKKDKSMYIPCPIVKSLVIVGGHGKQYYNCFHFCKDNDPVLDQSMDQKVKTENK